MVANCESPDEPFGLRAALGADVSIDADGISLYSDIEAYFDLDDGNWTRITLTRKQAAALGRFLLAVSNAEG